MLRTRTVAVQARQQPNVSQRVAAGVAAAVLTVGAPAMAGVILEQPSLKKVFQDDAPAASAPASAVGAKKAAPAAAAPKKAAAPKAAETSEGGVSPQALALPAALVVVGGGAFALSQVDAGFNEFMRTAAVKDSSADGAGYETDLKGDGPIGKPKRGTTKVVAKSKPGSKKGTAKGNSPLSSFFGDN